MLNILKIDLYISKKNILFTILYCLLFTAVFKGNAISLVSSVSVYALVIGLMASEERDSINRMYSALPISAKAIAGAKYIDSIIAICIAAAAAVLGQLCFGHIIPALYDGVSQPEMLNSVLVSVITGMLLVAVMIPVVYKFGYGKSRTIVLVFWLCAAFASPMLGVISENSKLGTPLLFASAVVCALLLLASWFVSVSIISRK